MPMYLSAAAVAVIVAGTAAATAVMAAVAVVPGVDAAHTGVSAITIAGPGADAAHAGVAAAAQQDDDQNDDPQRTVAAPTVVPTEHEYFTSLKIAPGRCPRVLYHSMAHSCPG